MASSFMAIHLSKSDLPVRLSVYCLVGTSSACSAVLSKNADFGAFSDAFELARNTGLFRGFGVKNPVFMRLFTEDEADRT